ncbi:MAG: type II toxin-antitoxin system VapC family toxin [Terriglobales bacterium]
MRKIVLDASAMLAVLNEEPGSEKLTLEMLNHSIGSTVNLAEVQTKLVSRGEAADDAWEDALSSIQEPMPFTEEHAKIAGGLVAQTRSLGLSLGDRACLALGIASNAPVYTTDRSWKNLKVGVRIHVLR